MLSQVMNGCGLLSTCESTDVIEMYSHLRPATSVREEDCMLSRQRRCRSFSTWRHEISEGGLLLESEGGALSPPDGGRAPSHSPISLVPSSSPNPPPPPASNPPSHPPAHLSNYQNGQGGDLSGGRLSSSPPPALPRDRRTSNSSTTPSPPPAVPALPPRVQYTEASLPELSDNGLPLEGNDSEKRVSYSKIDLKQTDEYNQQLAKLQAEAESAHPLPDITNAEFTIITPSDNSKKNSRSRGHAHLSSSGSSHCSMSDGNFASGREAHSKANGSIPTIPEWPETQQPNYINITPQPNYINITPQPGLRRKSSMANSSPLATSPPRLIPGRDPMGTYADLDLPKTCTPRPVPNKDDFVQYSFMNFEVMEAIRKTKEEREEEIRLRMEEEVRAEERKKEEEKAEEKLAKKMAKKKAKKQNKKKKSS